MLVALETKNNDCFIIDTLPCPLSNDPLHETWKPCNKMVISWLTRSMTPTIKQSVMWATCVLPCELQWIQYLLQDLDFSVLTPYTAFCDKKSAIHIAKIITSHERTKHVELDCHVIQQKLVDGLIHLLRVPSTSHRILLLSGLLLPSWTFTRFMPTLIGVIEIIYFYYSILLLLNILFYEGTY